MGEGCVGIMFVCMIWKLNLCRMHDMETEPFHWISLVLHICKGFYILYWCYVKTCVALCTLLKYVHWNLSSVVMVLNTH